jgi:hypothetical protein
MSIILPQSIEVKYLPSAPRYGGDLCSIPRVVLDGKMYGSNVDYVKGRRIVYIGNGYVIKVNHPEIIDQTIPEVKFWNMIKHKADARYFVPILKFSIKQSFVIMPYIDFTDDIDEVRNDYPNACDEIQDVIVRYELDGDIDVEYISNWGVDRNTGRPVIYDYGYNMFMEDFDG